MTELREEQESRCSIGDGFYVFFVVAAIVASHQVVKDAHDAHQKQEAHYAFSKQVARCALRGLPQVSNEVLLSH